MKIVFYSIALIILLALLLFFSQAKFIIVISSLFVFTYVLLWGLEKHNRIFILKWLLVAILLRGLATLLINTYAPPTYDGFFFPDAQSYHRWGKDISDMWHEGIFPDLYNEAWLKTFHTAYYRIVAALYYVFGAHRGIPIVLNCLMSGFMILFIYYTALMVFHSDQSARYSAVIMALHPSFWFWSSFVLKDTLHVFVFIWALLVFLMVMRSYNFWMMLLLMALMYFLFRVRAYGCLLLTISFIVYLLAWSKRPVILAIVFCAGLGIFVVAGIVEPVRAIYDRMLYSFLNLLPDEYYTSLPMIYIYFIAGIIKFLLAPFAWVFGRTFDIHYLLYPGQWFLYLVILPYALVGIYYAVKLDNKESLLLILPIVFSVYLFLLVYRGAVPRQRLFIESLFILLSGYGISIRPGKKYLIVYYIVFISGIIAHLISMYLRFGTIIP